MPARQRLQRVGAALAAGGGEQAQLLRQRLAELQAEHDDVTMRLGALAAATDGDFRRVLPPAGGPDTMEKTVEFFRQNGFWCAAICKGGRQRETEGQIETCGRDRDRNRRRDGEGSSRTDTAGRAGRTVGSDRGREQA